MTCLKSIQDDFLPKAFGVVVPTKYKNLGTSGYLPIFRQRHGAQNIENQKEVSLTKL